MKKSLFLLFASISFAAANAQQITSKRGFPVLPEKGDWAISVNADGIFNWVGNLANGSGANNVADLDGNQTLVSPARALTLVGKKFTSDKTALRVTAGLRFGNTTNKWEDETANGVDADGDLILEDALDNTFKQSVTNFGLTAGLGKEWRRGKTRLQGYYGADVLLTVNSTTEKWTNSEEDVTDYETVKVRSGLGFGIGANAFIGAEYFIFPKMAIGAQYEAGLNINIAGAPKATTTPWVGDDEDGNLGNSSTSFGLGPVGVASIRLTLHF
jgi:hypothetical protein